MAGIRCERRHALEPLAILMAGAIFAAIVGLPTAAHAALWGAMAVGTRADGALVWCGYGVDRPTKGDAVYWALHYCAGFGNPRIAVTFADGAGAIVFWGSGGYAGGSASTADAAIEDAKTSALKYDVARGTPIYIGWLTTRNARPQSQAVLGNFHATFDLDPPERYGMIISAREAELIGESSRFHAALRPRLDNFTASDFAPFRFKPDRGAPLHHLALVLVVRPKSPKAVQLAARNILWVAGRTEVHRFAFAPDDFPGGARDTFVVRDLSKFKDVILAFATGDALEGTTFFEPAPGVSSSESLWVRRVYLVRAGSRSPPPEHVWKSGALRTIHDIAKAQFGANHAMVMPTTIR